MIDEELILRKFCRERLQMKYEDLTEENKNRVKDLLSYSSYELNFRLSEAWIILKNSLPKFIREML